MNEMILIILSIGGIIFGLYALYSMKCDFLKEFEKSCYDAIERREKELEEKEELNKALKEWLFK